VNRRWGIAGAATIIVTLTLFGLPWASVGSTLPVSIYGVNGNDGGREGDDHDGDIEDGHGGDPNPVCTGAATCAYTPNPTNIVLGDSVQFTNVGGMKHTATGSVNFTPSLKEVVQPGGGSCPSDPGVNGNCFSTGKLKRGGSITIGPFNISSSFEYYCEIHGPAAMIATLNVNGGGGTTTTTSTAPSTTTTAGATTTTAAPSTTTTAASTTTTSTAPSTTTTAPATTTTAATTSTTATPMTTTTTVAACTRHDIVVQLPASQPSMKLASFVKVYVIVTNAGNCAETATVTLSGTINYEAQQITTVVPGGSQTLFFDYTVPVRLEVTLTASAPVAGDATPANNSDTKTYPTTVL